MAEHRSVEQIQTSWDHDARWRGIKRPYSAEDIAELRGTVRVEYSLAQMGAERLWNLLQTDQYLPALGALTGNMAIQQVEAGLEVVYVSGWQVAADNNLSGEMYPDQSLYPSNSVPTLVRRINNALMRADQIQHADGRDDVGPYWFAPIVADAEAGFGGNLNAFVLMKQMIEAGAAGVHFEDQLSSAKKCGRMGGRALVPTQEAIDKLVAARLASDIVDVPTVLIARTDASGAFLLTSDVDEQDRPLITGGRTADGFYNYRGGIEAAIARGKAYAPYADIIWCETAKPDLDEARTFADAMLEAFPGKLLSYNCSPSFNWAAHLDGDTIATFQQELAAMGYKFQFVTLAGFHALHLGMFDMARSYKQEGMAAYARLQTQEFEHEPGHGYMGTTHQRFVGAHYFDIVAQRISGADASTASEEALEEAQY